MSNKPPLRRRTGMELQDVVQRRIDELVETELGLQVAVYRHGELVVDAVAGDGVTSETLYFAASTGKGASATVANVLVDRGVLNYDRPIVEPPGKRSPNKRSAWPPQRRNPQRTWDRQAVRRIDR